MDQRQIEEIVNAVIQQMGASGNASGSVVSQASSVATSSPVIDTEKAKVVSSAPVSAGSLPDLGGDEFQRNWIGVQNPKNIEVLKELRKNTTARVCTGRVGPRPRTLSLLRFLADHSRSKDTVLKEIPAEWVEKAGLLEVRTDVDNKDVYLTRPDKGRRLSQDGINIIKSKCKQNPKVQILVSDGLSTDAVTANLDEIMPPLIRGLQNAGYDLGTNVFIRYGRVKVEDQIGMLVGAEVVILLVGERPGLGQSESLSCYMVYKPNEDTVEADRTCISNIHKGGTPPVEAAAVIVDMTKLMLEKKASGIGLNR